VPCRPDPSELDSEDYRKHRAFLYGEEIEMAKGKWEDSPADKRADKKAGVKEGSPKDEAMDRKGQAKMDKKKKGK
jgi:hypothetical protein